MRLIAALVALFGLSIASSMDAHNTPKYPEKSSSRGFHLIANVTDWYPRHLANKVHGQPIEAIFLGQLNYILGIENGLSRIFYQNGTDRDLKYGEVGIVSDGGAWPVVPYGMWVRREILTRHIKYSLRLNPGIGHLGLSISRAPSPYAVLELEMLAVCKEPIGHRGFAHAMIMRSFQDPNTDRDETQIPKECVPVRLIPQCTPLMPVSHHDMANHAFVQRVDCYQNVSAIDWTKYAPFPGSMDFDRDVKRVDG